MLYYCRIDSQGPPSQVIELPSNNEAVKISPMTLQEHSRHAIHVKELPMLLPRQPVRLWDPHTKKWYTRRGVLSRDETSNLCVEESPKGVNRINSIYTRKQQCTVHMSPQTI